MVYDYCVVGGGIVGLATAMKLLEMQPGARLVVLEKEAGLSRHQTGHNSGVIHAGIYYAPGSLKADLCRRGSKATKEFCWNHRIPFETCGKLLVATNELELQRMNNLVERAKLNQIEVERLDAADLRQREPNIIGVGGLFVPETGVSEAVRESGLKDHVPTKIVTLKVRLGDGEHVNPGLHLFQEGEKSGQG